MAGLGLHHQLRMHSASPPGDTAVITRTGGKTTIKKTNNPPWTFAKTCSAAAGLCSATQYASASPTVTPPLDDGGDPTGMLCGR